MKAVLELKKEKVGESIFYRYNVEGTLVWFEQYVTNGHIYTVAVRTLDWIGENFQFYVQDGSMHEHYYPEFVEINISHKELTMGQVDGYVNGLMYAKKVAEAIMDIFESGEHIELYKLHHNEM
jgi:hypothetical protein